MGLHAELGAAPADRALEALDFGFELCDGCLVLSRGSLARPAEDERGEPRLRGGELVEQGAVLRVEAAAQGRDLVGDGV